MEPATSPSRRRKPAGCQAADSTTAAGRNECCCSPSCTAGAIADCVALCCCPCALLNFLALAFVKIPWTVGRRCLRRKNKKKKKKKGALMMEMVMPAADGGVESGEVVGEMIYVVERSDGSRSLRVVGDEEDGGGAAGRRRSAKYEAEKVWLELYQVGHLGFGRVSFTGISTSS